MTSLRIALATGRTAKQAIGLLEQAGIYFPAYHSNTRKLVMTDTTGMLQLILVKTADLPTYVEKGAADIGVIGKDLIVERQPDVYELVDLQIGKCLLALAGFPQTKLTSPLVVATKYPVMTKEYFDQKGIQTELIQLNGSIELAPLIGLSDVIVDIVETGTTLKENGLVILDEIMPISTRLIVNKASFATKTEGIEQVIEKIKTGLEVSI